MENIEFFYALQQSYEARRPAVIQKQEEFWNSFSKEDQLALFCAVIRRIHQGEIVDQGSYRHVLYTVFEFDRSAYGLAQEAGFLDIHNAIVTGST
jgi:hypothetical protein